MPDWLTVSTVMVLINTAAVAFVLATVGPRQAWDMVAPLWREAIRMRSIVAAPFVVVAVAAIYVWLRTTYPALGASIYSSSGGENVNVSGYRGLGWLGVLLLLPVLVLLLPEIVRIEERIFRSWATTYSRLMAQACLFGAAHLIVGVPYAAAIGLVIAGMAFGLWFKVGYDRAGRECGLANSRGLHLAYNSILLGFASIVWSIA